ncbi:dipeptidyl carboxypeptidase II [Oleiagrimonas soli]|uniref:Dipeptidyl carboxypeptidase n=2 Tax=Oleiagrimonas soli TaxID=1543381 RepID=A0A099CYT0_9GAMM|nr:dipeptidyl carboxypeptidase II [Oleiagrimonas soli]MBB6184437.1 peptidyl-dipeptidase Dcp [Oleiagrimonas soli]
MRTITLAAAIAAVVAVSGCSQSSSPSDKAAGPQASAPAPSGSAPAKTRENPLLTKSDLPFQAPPFDKIKDSDFAPAFEQGMKEQLTEVQKIADNPDKPTFDNTLVAMEKSGQTLNRVQMDFNALFSANSDDALSKVNEDMAPKLAAHSDAIYLNDKLFQRIQTLYNERDSLKLDPESERLLEWYYNDFVHHGAKLSDADKTKLKSFNEQASKLESQFVNKLLAATKAGALVVDDKSKLDGLSEGEIAAAAQAAKDRGLDGKWVLPLQNTTQQPALAELTNRDVRKQLFENSYTRTEKGDANDTRKTIAELAKVRAEKAKLLGYPNYAAWKLEDQMAKTPDAVLKFVRALVPPTMAKARHEAGELQSIIDKSGKHFKLQAWDWEFYAEKLRKAKYDLDQDQIKPYFEVDNVLKNGVFYAAHELYGLTFKERKDIPVYNPDVKVFEVFDKDGKPLGLFYADYFKRDNKQGGAWMDNLVGQSKLLGTKPVIYNVCNFTKPAPGQPALISWDDVTTMFHEFGHALHGFFASQQYPSLSGTNVARDFVEFPSQFNEHWASYPQVFNHYAKNYKTGEPMPKELAAKIHKAATFNQGYDLGELLSASLLDMSWHMIPADAPLKDVDQFEAQALKDNHTDLSYLPPRYRSSYFMHIWGNGYSAGYYAYLWTEMLDDDAYQWFENHGGMTRANGQRFRDMILSRGNTEDLGKMFRDFYGKDPEVGPMLKDRGLK